MTYNPRLVETWPLLPPPRASTSFSTQTLFGTSGSDEPACAATQCPPNSSCRLGALGPECACNPSFVDVGGGQCGCRPGYHVENGSCVQNAPASPCQGVSCPTNATCHEGQCYCDVGYHAEGAACVPNQTACPPGTVFDGVACVAAVQCPPGMLFDGVSCVDRYEQLPPTPGFTPRTSPVLILLGVALVGAVVLSLPRA